MSETYQIALYAAQSSALYPVSRVFADRKQIKQYVEDLNNDPYFTAKFGEVVVEVVAKPKGRFIGQAHTSQDGPMPAGVIALVNSSSGFALVTVLHELAHILTDGSGHGPAFADNLLWLVRQYMGVEAYAAFLQDLAATEPFSYLR